MNVSPTVARVPLMAGERVLYFHKPDQQMARLWYFIGGIVLLPLLIGIYLLYVGIKFDEKATHYWVVTNFRLFTANARGKILEQIGVPEITNLVHKVGAGTNSLIVHSQREILMFRMDERHDLRRLKPLLENLKNPQFIAQAPPVAFEP